MTLSIVKFMNHKLCSKTVNLSIYELQGYFTKYLYYR